MIRREVLRLAVCDCRLGLCRHNRSAWAATAPKPLPDAKPKHLPGGVASTCSTSSGLTTRSRSTSETSQISPSWVSTSCACRWITAAGPTATIPEALKEPVLKEIDQAVEFGEKHGVHVQINFHRGPGSPSPSPPSKVDLE